MKRLINKSLYLLYIVSLLLSALTACKKSATELPGGVADNALNFYSASDVMLAAYGSTAPYTTAVQVDAFQKNLSPFVFSPSNKFPVFSYQRSDALEFPTIDNGFMNFAYYDNKAAGHRLFFTDTANVVVLDTIIHPAPKSYSCIYLADAPANTQNNPAQYRMLTVTEDRSGVPAGKTGVRFVHLSPDAGSLDCSLIKADNSTVLLLPDKLNYGQASSYQYLDTTATSAGLIKLTMTNANSGAVITTGVLFAPGHSYIVLINGFYNDQQRQVRSGTNPDGSTKYTTVTINRNLRAIIRKSY